MKRTTLVVLSLAALASTAEARSPEPRDMERVAGMAHRLEDASQHVYVSAREYLPRWGYSRGEARILDRLKDLAAQSDRFHREVERNYRDPRRTEDDFERLVKAYTRAADSLDDLGRWRGHVAQDFDRVRELMRTLIPYYGGYDRYGVVLHAHDRDWNHDHDGDRDHHDDHDRDDHRDPRWPNSSRSW